MVFIGGDITSAVPPSCSASGEGGGVGGDAGDTGDAAGADGDVDGEGDAAGVVGDDDPPVSWVVPSAMRLSASPRALDSGPRVAHATSDTFFGSIDTIFILASMPSRLAKRVLRKGDGLQGNVSKSLPALQPVGAGGLILVGDCFRTVEIHLAAGGSAGLAILVIDGKEDRTAFHLLVGGPSFPTAPPDPLVPLL